jgi:hypothetical protein
MKNTYIRCFTCFIFVLLSLSANAQENLSDSVKELNSQLESLSSEIKTLDKNLSTGGFAIAETDWFSYKRQVLVYQQKFLERKIEVLNYHSKEEAALDKHEEILKNIHQKLSSRPSQMSMEDYRQINQTWREIVDSALGRLFQRQNLSLPEFPKVPNAEGVNESLVEELKLRREGIYLEINRFEEKLSELYSKRRDKGSRSLLQAGRLRAEVMGLLIEKAEFSVWALGDSLVSDFVREFKIVPYRFIASFEEQYFKFFALSAKGIKGWVEIIWQLFLLIFVLLIPFMFLKFFRYVSSRLEQFRKDVFTNSSWSYQRRTKLALWIGRINPYVPWIFAFLALWLSEELLKGTLLDALSLFFPYLNIYVVYRMFSIAFSSLLAKLLLKRSLSNLRSKQEEVRALAFKLSVLFFTEWAILHATEDMVRRAIIYNLVYDVVLYFNLFVIAVESRKWKAELLEIAEQWLPVTLVQKFAPKRNVIVECIVSPFLFFGNSLFVVLQSFYNWVSQFEFGKQISSELFKRRLEEASADTETEIVNSDETYRSMFERTDEFDSQLYVRLSRSPLDRCEKIINQWKDEKTLEDLILLYGNIGIGKTTILNYLSEKFSPSTRVITIKLEQRLTNREAFFEHLSQAFGVDFNCSAALEELDKELEKTLVVIDDIHNLYINTINGLEVYRALIELSSLQLSNIFWLFSCNERALAHLNGLFGANHFVGTKIELGSWTDSEIQELIMKRHNRTKYRLRFDQVISAVHRGDVLESSSGIEVQFFRLLWGQSRGNPSTALELWLSASHRLRGNIVKISVPDFTSSKTLSSLSDEALMCFASLVKHESLNFSELCETTRVPFNVIRQALKFGEDNQLLQQLGNKRWRIHPKSQYVVYSQLSARNLVYG